MNPAQDRLKPRLDRRLWAEARRCAPHALRLSLVSLAILGGVIVLQGLFLSQIIQRAFFLEQSLADLIPRLVALLGVVVMRAILSYGHARASAQVAIQLKQHLRQRFMAHLLQLGTSLSAERSGELVTSASEGIEKLEGYYRDYLPAVFNALFLPVLILCFVLPLDALTFVILAITAPLIPLFMALIGMAAGALARQQFMALRHLGAHFVDVMQGLTTLKLFNRSHYQIESIQRMTERFRETTMQVLRVAFLSALSLEMLATLSVAIVAVEIGVRLLYGNIQFEQALFLLVIAPEFYLPLRSLGARFHNATEGKASAERLYEVLDMPVLAEASAHSPSPTHFQHIRFEGVSLAYPHSSRPSLSNIHLSLERGQWVALVGASGSGKTSLANLLLGFVQASEGQIYLDGQALEALDIASWREQLAWVSQTPYVFNASVLENIRFSRPSASLAEVQRAAELAGAHAFIEALPQGYATPCGERGLRLSGGQIQRLALARALLRQAPVLILDEPTSQLDPANEAHIMRHLRQASQGALILHITHRLHSARYADHILVLEAGELLEQGTHDDLLARQGVYWRLVQEDAQGDGYETLD